MSACANHNKVGARNYWTRKGHCPLAMTTGSDTFAALQEALLAHGHAKAEAQHAEQLARTLVEFRPVDQPPGGPSAVLQDASRPGYNAMPLVTYDDFERIWMSDSFSHQSLARH